MGSFLVKPFNRWGVSERNLLITISDKRRREDIRSEKHRMTRGKTAQRTIRKGGESKRTGVFGNGGRWWS